MSETIYQIYDKLIKKILTLSSTAIINLINGLFGTDYPPDSTITYNWTEFEDNQLKRILADTIITINGQYSYHIEAQMTKDHNITLRMFEYGFSHALRTAKEIDGIYHVNFPAPIVIYLYYEGDVPDEYLLQIDFASQKTVEYKFPTFCLPDTSAEELSQKKMVVLIPFHLLKLRKIMEKERSEENLEALKNLLQHDILGSINDNLRAGNITIADAQQLKSYTHLLYNHLYSHYAEMENFNDMMDESIMTDADIIVKECEERFEERLNQALHDKDGIIAQMDNLIAEKDNTIAEKDNTIAEKDNLIKKKNNSIAEKDNTIAEKEKEILLLKQKIAELEGAKK